MRVLPCARERGRQSSGRHRDAFGRRPGESCSNEASKGGARAHLLEGGCVDLTAGLPLDRTETSQT